MSGKILLVDDDPNILDTAKDILEDAGYYVAIADSQSAALDCLEKNSFNVMITDLNLPDGSGLELAGKARAKFPRLPILLMTGQADGAQPAGLTARQHGEVDEYLVKPVSPAQLLNILRRVIG
jgi:DNA-binding response OmpR family regulator